ncbi:trihelix transcription factor PTL-like [Juglans microcarpa x Juglans regia]|uniref:trihelix transcription factor PTL-like n=1 Tax=Juglans microcarpa x Juglans regia TaxID=2249226 RepID=UPI001B7E1AAA|nr:trihelix transcription factor PTL-like [Juglans microcarpa x Juglans regia]
MGDQYGLPDFRQFMVGRTHFPSIAQPTESFFPQRNAAAPLHYEPIMVGEVLPRGLVGFGHDSPSSVTPTTATATSSAAATLCGSVQMDSGWMGYDMENTRWPRQETLTLLEIRSRLDSKFKETNQKGPLWDEVSRLMAEEYGYQRSGKKCKEKFENLYKYYKKTKERKSGRQGGKHYRFFRQLEAIYGEASNHATVSDTHLARNSLPNYQIPHNVINQENQEVDLRTPRLSDQSLSFSNSSEFETSSSEHRMNYQSMEKQIGMNEIRPERYSRNKKNWKAKIEDFVDSQMRKIMDTQEVWMDRLLKTIEDREQERVFREEEWRKQEAARFDQEVHHIWTKEREWVEARDAALMEALKKFIGKGLEMSQSAEPMAVETRSHSENQDENGKEITYINNSRWTELEVSSLIELRTSLELRFQDGGHLDESLWEEIAAKMGSLGYDRSAVEYKEKWQHISIYYNKAIMECNKKRKEDLDLRTGSYFQQFDYYLGQEISKQRPESIGLQLTNEGSLPPSSSNDRDQADVHQHGFRHGGENLWEKYGVRYYKGKTSKFN